MLPWNLKALGLGTGTVGVVAKMETDPYSYLCVPQPFGYQVRPGWWQRRGAPAADASQPAPTPRCAAPPPVPPVPTRAVHGRVCA